RKLDAAQSQPWRPYHTHDEKQPLQPGQAVDVQVEILPTCIVVPAGYRIGLTVRGRDYEFAKTTGARLGHFKNELLGCGPFLHDEPRDRDPAIVHAPVTLHFGPDSAPLLLPVIQT
ncbi:MAG: peptidase S15, partial [Comamonadaceae bacterium]